MKIALKNILNIIKNRFKGPKKGQVEMRVNFQKKLHLIRKLWAFQM